uniref:Uncharacterized protein n=1 Tax=Anguilla anguilla TaxID=7936 RepID=A0A0E9UAK4_ANGAN
MSCSVYSPFDVTLRTAEFWPLKGC